MKNLPVTKKAIPCKWVYKLKTNSDWSIDKYKERLVIKGYSQRKGEDYDQIYSPVAKGAKKELKTLSDADHGGDDTTGRSTTGVSSMYADGAMSWYRQRQTSVAISTTEAEIVAASEAAREIVWLKRLFEEIIVLRAVPTLIVDNGAAIKLAENPEYHRRTEHIHIRHFFVRELVLDSFIQVKKVSSEDQLADIVQTQTINVEKRNGVDQNNSMREGVEV
ncbi:hypothetical protein JTB14_021193 [Gonioctena quinquepunctata]|nr:hypothetical protein JTB14_021193 [Gonioctena quinquepunctata]